MSLAISFRGTNYQQRGHKQINFKNASSQIKIPELANNKLQV
jgi:hypothetical protein